jgi:hypothetical protein
MAVERRDFTPTYLYLYFNPIGKGGFVVQLYEFDKSKYYLGELCRRGHDWNETGSSMRRKKKGKDKGGNCVECSSITDGQYYSKNRQKKLARSHQQRLEKPEKSREWKRKFYQRHRSEENARLQRLRDGYQLHQVPYTEADIQFRNFQFSNRCAYCGCECKSQPTRDHFISRKKGGPDVLSNILPACSPCNSSKNASDPWEWYGRQKFFSKDRWLYILKILGKTEQTYNQLPLF